MRTDFFRRVKLNLSPGSKLKEGLVPYFCMQSHFFDYPHISPLEMRSEEGDVHKY